MELIKSLADELSNEYDGRCWVARFGDDELVVSINTCNNDNDRINVILGMRHIVIESYDDIILQYMDSDRLLEIVAREMRKYEQ